MGNKGDELTLSLSRVSHVARTDKERQTKIEQAHRYYGRFDNVFTGPGIVENGMITELPCKTPIKELGESLLICTPQEMVDKLGPYADRPRNFESEFRFTSEPNSGVNTVFCRGSHATL